MDRFTAIAQRAGVAAGQHRLHFRQDGECHLPGIISAEIEPLPPIVPDHWELGVSEVGETSILH